MEEIIKTKRDQTQARWVRASKDHAFDLIRDLAIFETRSEHFLRVSLPKARWTSATALCVNT